MSRKFKAEIQFTHPQQNQILGLLEPADVVRAFDDKNWGKIAEDMLEDDLSPTFIVRDEGDSYLWASVYGDQNDFNFVVETQLAHETEESSFLGLFKKKVSPVVIHGEFNFQDTRQIIELYVSDQHEKIYEQYKDQ